MSERGPQFQSHVFMPGLQPPFLIERDTHHRKAVGHGLAPNASVLRFCAEDRWNGLPRSHYP